jgi:GMP synthase (glutamine-hydrolysing)
VALAQPRPSQDLIHASGPDRAQILVLDAGGQYCHLIARKVRELGVYSQVKPSETPAAELSAARGIIISGGPASVYDPESPTVDPALFGLGKPVLGICYGQHLMAHLLGGAVRKGQKGEYGLAVFERENSRIGGEDPLLGGLGAREQIWMSHRDTVAQLPPGFGVLGSTATCAVAAMSAPDRRLYGLQFHPEVVHTRRGQEILANFVMKICGCERDWDPSHRAPQVEEQIREAAAGRKIFFFVSGGVDSTVAYTLCIRALGSERVRGVYVDTGLMREGETDFVRSVFEDLAPGTLTVEDAARQFLAPLVGVKDPEEKRRIIGEEFVKIQERIVEAVGLLEGGWILGQGTIYPDTIESGGTKKAALIKTHHNRVPGIQRLIEAKRIVEPLSSFYKDEVRELGRELELPEALLSRHPFPGPGLAIRCLCAHEDAPPVREAEGFIVPVRSVGVQGDERSYAPVLALEHVNAGAYAVAGELINRIAGINRVIGLVQSRAPLSTMQVFESSLELARLERLRRADAIVQRLCRESGYDRQVWQFPVVLIPFGTAEARDSVVLRPVDSVDGMTAQAMEVPDELLRKMAQALLAIDGICAVFCDLTHKPPATIEWE